MRNRDQYRIVWIIFFETYTRQKKKKKHMQ